MRRLGRRLASGRIRFSGSSSSASGRVSSWALAAALDTLLLLGVVALVCGLAGAGDDNSDAITFGAAGAALASAAALARRRVSRPKRPTARHVITGIGLIWLLLTAVGTAIYMATGTVSALSSAIVEAAAGFTTTAVTGLEAAELSRAQLLWRAATSWVGGLVAITLTVIALPLALRGSALLAYVSPNQGRSLVPNARAGIRRVAALYCGFSAACVLAYAAAGLEITEAVVVGLGTTSTGGFSPRPDSLAGYGPGIKAVATAGMLVAGASVFVLWWAVHGSLRPLARSRELHAYGAFVALIVAVLALTGDAGPGEALFTAASVISTTGYAAGDWTTWSASATAVLLVAAGIGSMLGSVGGGVRVLRVQLLFKYAKRELLRQLNPHTVLLVRRSGQSVPDRPLDRVAGYSISHIALVGFGAVLLGLTGLSLADSLWAAVSAASTLGPAVGEIGAFGRLESLEWPSQAVLVPLMLTGRAAILPVLAVLGFILRGRRTATRRARRLRWQTGRLWETARKNRAGQRTLRAPIRQRRRND